MKTNKLQISLLTLGLGICFSAAEAQFSLDFSSPITEVDANSTSPWIGTGGINMPSAGNYTFLEDFATITRDSVDNNADISGAANIWLLINTQNWSEGDYTVSFDGQVTSGDTMYWDAIGGNASGNLAVRVWMNKDRPYIRATSAGTATRLGQINAQGDTAGAATAAVAAGSFTDTSITSQSLTITLSGGEVGSTNDYLLIGWNNTGGNGDATIDNISIAAVPEPSSFALVFGLLASGWFLTRRRRA